MPIQYSSISNDTAHVPSNVERDELIAVALQSADKMLVNLAYKYHLSLEDIRQDAALLICRMWQQGKFANTRNIGYMVGAIRHEITNIYVRDADRVGRFDVIVESLDEPLYEEDSACLADMLPAPQMAAIDEEQEAVRTQALYEALWRLPLECQQHIRRSYKLNAFEPRWLDRSIKPNLNRNRSSVQKNAHRALRRDKQLAEVLATYCSSRKEVLVTYSHGL